MMRKPIHAVTEAEFRRFPVWRYVLDMGPDEDETFAQPIPALPCRFSPDLVLAARLELANGEPRFGVLHGLSPRPEVNEHLLAIEIFSAGVRLRLARCYDLDLAEYGPAPFAARLGLAEADVFPIRYDVAGYFREPAAGFRGEIWQAPEEPLSEQEFIALCVRADIND